MNYMSKVPMVLHKGKRSNAILVYIVHLHTMQCYDILAFCIFQRGVDFCRGENVSGVTTHEQMNYTASPVLFHLGRDPGEKYPIRYVY